MQRAAAASRAAPIAGRVGAERGGHDRQRVHHRRRQPARDLDAHRLEQQIRRPTP